MYLEQQTPESLLSVWSRGIRAIPYSGSTGTISTKWGEGQSLPPDGAREQVCNSQNISVIRWMINNHVIGDAKHVIDATRPGR